MEGPLRMGDKGRTKYSMQYVEVNSGLVWSS
jgi:hypothetical protein